MKKIILILTATALFAACKQKSYTDAAGMQHQIDSLKMQQQIDSLKQAQQNNVAATRTRTVYRSYPAQTTAATEKQGMRRATKNALIGAGVGAATGAIISKDGNRVKGAVIGGVLGAGAGYIYGKQREKKKGKY
jgi:hypothetical protein